MPPCGRHQETSMEEVMLYRILAFHVGAVVEQQHRYDQAVLGHGHMQCSLSVLHHMTSKR